MQSCNFNLIVSNAHEYSFAARGDIASSEVHRIMLTNFSWMPRNMHVLINDTMRQRLGLGFDKTLPWHYLGSEFDTIVSSRGPYRTCENVYLAVDPITYALRSIAYPLCVPDLPVDFVLGTLYFDDFNLKWNSKLDRLITREEEEEAIRRQTYRFIL